MSNDEDLAKAIKESKEVNEIVSKAFYLMHYVAIICSAIMLYVFASDGNAVGAAVFAAVAGYFIRGVEAAGDADDLMDIIKMYKEHYNRIGLSYSNTMIQIKEYLIRNPGSVDELAAIQCPGCLGEGEITVLKEQKKECPSCFGIGTIDVRDHQ